MQSISQSMLELCKSGKKPIISNMLPAESENSFSDVGESDGSDVESNSEKDFGTI